MKSTVKMSSIIPEVQRRLIKAIGKGMFESALLVDKSAKENCPVDTGRLRASITFVVNGGDWQEFTLSTDPKNPSEAQDHKIDKRKPMNAYKANAVIGTNVVYARFQEYNHATKSGYMRRALDDNREAVKKIMRYWIKEACDK
jgi:hypothetical protein